MIFKPHSFTVSESDRSGDGSDEYFNPISMRGQLTPTSSTKAFESYGVEVERPWLLMTDLANDANLPVGAKVVWDTKVFKIASGTMPYSMGTISDHTSCILQEI